MIHHGKVTNTTLDITNESQGVSPFPAGDNKAPINRRMRKHDKHKTEIIHKLYILAGCGRGALHVVAHPEKQHFSEPGQSVSISNSSVARLLPEQHKESGQCPISAGMIAQVGANHYS